MQYVKISLLIKPEQKPPYFIGSQLRGAFGYALKKVTCINPIYKCENCFSATNCTYYQFFEKKNSFHSYRFDFELGTDLYDFNLYLFEEATGALPYIVSSLHMMLTKKGLGKERRTYKDFNLYINDSDCLINGEIKLPKKYIQTFDIKDYKKNITLTLVTPLRIKKHNRFVRDENIELEDIINSIYQRQMQIIGKGHKKFPYPIEADIVEKDLHYKELTRMSNRQKTTMNLGGIMGEIKINGLSRECYNILKVGELIGVGKSTVFGLGKIKMEEIDE